MIRTILDLDLDLAPLDSTIVVDCAPCLCPLAEEGRRDRVLDVGGDDGSVPRYEERYPSGLLCPHRHRRRRCRW
jgi:hypothetical protein